MEETNPTRILDAPNNMENDNEQQYIEIGSNMYIGTKDEMKYTLIQTSDNKFRLVETISDTSEILTSSKGSNISSLKSEKCNEGLNEWITERSGSKLIKLIAAKSEPSPCKGQGDEIGNTVLSPSVSISNFKELDNTLDKNPLEVVRQDIDSSSELTYTTLVPRQERTETLNSMCYQSPENDYYNYSPTFATPIAIRPARYVRKSRMQFIPAESSPIRGTPSRQRRPRQTTYQYNPQILHSTPSTASSLSNDSQMSVCASSSGSHSTDSYNKSQSSIDDYPRVPNNTPNTSEVVEGSNQGVFSLQWMPEEASGVENYISLDPRESHNEKERKRRLRIKNACHSMRSLIPSVTDKTDNATVFEQAVYFIAFVRDAVGNGHDLEFLEHMYVL